MTNNINSLDEFMNHGKKAGGNAFLSGWKKLKPPVINVVMHTGLYPQPVWQHSFPTVYVGQDKVTKKATTKVFSKRYVCHENEDILKKQYFRGSDGRREHPPERCPMCRLIEVVREGIAEGELSWTEKIFGFHNPQDGKDTFIHAGGLTGMFNSRDLTEEHIRDLNEHGISQKKDWGQKAVPNLAYIYAVVDLADVKKGVQLATETQALKDAIINVVEGAIKSLGPERGNPWRSPYVIQWEHRPNEPDFKKMYAAFRIETMAIPPQAMELITGPPPDLSLQTTPFNATAMRATMEKHALVDLPWDEIFEGSQTPRQMAQQATGSTCAECGRPGHEAEVCPWAACDKCGKEMLQHETKCPSCGHEYAQPAQLPAGAGAVAADLLGKQAPVPAATTFGDPLGDPSLDDGDDIPF